MLDQQIEAILFASGKALTKRKLAEITGADTKELDVALEELDARLGKGGIQLVQHGNDIELVTRPEFAEVVRTVTTMETHGELTRPSLETLAILSYRGPLTRPEIEQIRGVQSSLILRNLMIRGLVEQKEELRLGQPVYSVTTDFVKYLGVGALAQLPEYDELHAHPTVERVLQELEPVKADDSTSQAPPMNV